MTATKQAVTLTILSVLMISAVVLAVIPRIAPTQANTAPQTTVQAPQPPTVEELFTLVNEERAKVGVAPLILDERLNKSAQQKADDMTTNNYYSHVDPNGRHGYDIAHEYATDICTNPGENMNWGKKTFTADGIMQSWIDSKPHYKGMINPESKFTGLGISGTKVVQHFC